MPRNLMLLAVALILTPALASCGPQDVRPASAGAAVAAASNQLERLESRYQDLRLIGQLMLPFLPARREEQIRAIDARIVDAFARARAATAVAARLTALDDAKRALDEYSFATGEGAG